MPHHRRIILCFLIGALKFQSVGSHDDGEPQFKEAAATDDCFEHPGDFGLSSPSPVPSTTSSSSTYEVEAGVNFSDESKVAAPETIAIKTNEAGGTSGQARCATVAKVAKVEVDHPQFVDHDADPDNLFDADFGTYFSIHRESTGITLELEEELDITGVAIDFFMNNAEEERIQTFDIKVKSADDDDWTTIISRKESSGEHQNIETFSFVNARTALYVRFESHGNTFNNWTALTEIEVCTKPAASENARFGGVKAVGKDLEAVAGQVCSETKKIAPKSVMASGSDDVRLMFDNNFDTRWSTFNTQEDSDLSNDKVKVTFAGDTVVSSVSIAFFDGHLARQHIRFYTQEADAIEWTPTFPGVTIAALGESKQTFQINMKNVHALYIVGKGNEVGFYTKISEIEIFGC